MNNPNLKYEFDRENHVHLLDGKPLTGCTTILGVLAKPALIPWAANQVVKYIEEHCDKEHDYYKVHPEELEEARKAHSKRKTDAGTYGTDTHELISQIIKEAIEKNSGYVTDATSSEKSVSNFITWAKDNKVKFLESERNIYSEPLWIGGIVDFVCEIEGKVWIGDIKTSASGIWPENFWQCAGYHLMLKDMGLYPKIKGYLILNLKESGEVLEKRSISNADSIKAFKACLDIYRVREKIKSQVI